MTSAPPLKLVLLGDSSVGKTSLVHRFATDKFDEYTSNTIGAAFITKEYSVSNRTIKFEIWDTAGQERYRSLTPMYYRNAKIALVCYDLSNMETFEKAKFWVDQLEASNEGDIKVILVGNKSDKVETNANEFDSNVQKYCDEHSMRTVSTSAKEGTGVEELFNSIVESLDDKFFDDYKAQSEDNPSDEGLLNVHIFKNANKSTCC